MLGYFLHIANVLNGGDKKKGQADGFEVGVLNKVHLFKDNNGVTMLQYVMRKMKEENPDFPKNFKESVTASFEKVKEIILRCSNSPLETFKTLVNERNGSFKSAESEFNHLLEAKENDRFVKTFSAEFAIKKSEWDRVMTYEGELKQLHKSACDMWTIAATEDMYTDSLLFLKTFYDFFTHAVKALPAEEKKRASNAPAQTKSFAGRRQTVMKGKNEEPEEKKQLKPSSR
jgi:hypothetical protein